MSAVGLVIAALLAAALGARGTMFVAIVFLMFLPITFLIGLITIQIFPPALAATGEFHSILHAGGDGVAAGRSSDTQAGGNMPQDSAATLRLGRVIVNSAVLIAFLAVIAGGTALLRLQRSIYEAFPGLSVRSGPAAFPVTVRIVNDGLDFANGSGGRWTCTAEIGIRKLRSQSFALDAGQTRVVTYSSFLGATNVIPADAEAAREAIFVQCRDESGVLHSVAF